MLAALSRGRTAFAAGEWREAYTQLTAADRQSNLEPADLDRLATAAYLVGQDAASIDARTRAHNGWLERGEVAEGIRSAFWLAFVMLDNPERQAHARGWLARVRRLLDEQAQPLVEEGFWLCATAFFHLAVDRNVEAAQNAFVKAAQIGGRFKDASLSALARHGEARTMIASGRAADGLAIFDEVMVSVTCGEVVPMVAGVVYCSVIGACHDVFDLRRARRQSHRTRGRRASAGCLWKKQPDDCKRAGHQ